ncbi:MAG TPA: hypothetical protein VMJ92_04120 [Candidatus Limnocylindrales bacterium]|nr:hypothetical protein [Candidatus Limnocylindrales bacterium]
MSEYDLVCDACARGMHPDDALVSWRADGDTDLAFALTHPACAPAEASERAEVRRLVWPNEYLAFVTARFGRRVADADGLAAIVWALAPFVMRHDNPSEMDAMRAASFGERPGVKPGSAPAAGRPPEGGK